MRRFSDYTEAIGGEGLDSLFMQTSMPSVTKQTRHLQELLIRRENWAMRNTPHAANKVAEYSKKIYKKSSSLSRLLDKHFEPNTQALIASDIKAARPGIGAFLGETEGANLLKLLGTL